MTGAVQHGAEVASDADARVPRVRPALRGRRMLLTLVVSAVFLVAMLASSIAGHPRIDLEPERLPPLPQPEQETPTVTPGALPPDQSAGSDVVLVIVGILLTLIVTALIVVALTWLIRALLHAWRERPLRTRGGADTDVDVVSTEATADAEPDAPTVRRGISAARAVIEVPADPGDAIVAAWVGLEETAADSGAGRGLSETPAEFTLRILLRRAGIGEPTRQLLRVYEGVRFGGHRASEDDLALAARALTLIEEGWR